MRIARQNAQRSGAYLQKPDITECGKCGKVIGAHGKRLENVYAYGGEWLCRLCYRNATNGKKGARWR